MISATALSNEYPISLRDSISDAAFGSSWIALIIVPLKEILLIIEVNYINNFLYLSIKLYLMFFL